MDTFGKDPAYSPFDLEKNVLEFLQETYDTRNSRLGSEKTISLKDYNIPMRIEDGKYLLPLHTAFDFLMWIPRSPWKILTCNGAAVFICGRETAFGYTDALSELGEVYFSQQPVPRSSELAEYGYNELCLMLDHFYGLKDSHHIDNFRGFFKNNGYEERLLSEDPKEADQALQDIVLFMLDDLHSNYNFPSWMSGLEGEPVYSGPGFSRTLNNNAVNAFRAAAERNMTENTGFYTESGNTAYISLGMMYTTITSEQYYSMELDENDQPYADVIAQIVYADWRINRENSPIENVVLDLSRNSGGDTNSPAFVLSWFLGEGYTTIANPFTGALGVTRYKADVNRDHQFTDEDTLKGRKKLFCLISPLTFSSANMTAAMLKRSGEVTMLGQTTQGGSGIVTPAVSGWDSIFTISGFKTVVSAKNGSWYDMDPGVVPDVYISDPDLFYNREKLTEFINGIYPR